MRTRILLMGLLLAAVANAQTIYHDASAFPLLGKATESTLTRYERLPDSLQNISRKPLWDLGRNSAGLAVRFRSNSTSISAKWEVADVIGVVEVFFGGFAAGGREGEALFQVVF